MTYSAPYSFIPGTKARAQEVNANFKYVLDTISDINELKLNKSLSNITQEGIDVIKNNSSHRNIGEIIASPLPISDVGLHLLDGSKLYGDGVYADFVDYIADLYNNNSTANYFTDETTWQTQVTQYGECGKFVYDSVNNTVRLPKISGIVEGTTDINSLGNLVQAGLPNITGSWHLADGGHYSADTNTADGAFTYEAPYLKGNNGGSLSDYGTKFYFDASRSSAIYGRSLTVQPQTVKVFYYIVVATSTKTDIQVDIDNIATDLNNKVNTDLSNTTTTGKSLMANMPMPSGRCIDLDLGASGTTFTAPANGWLCLVIGSVQIGEYIQFNATESGLTTKNMLLIGADASVAGSLVYCYMPMMAAQQTKIYYNASGQVYAFRFIYANGEAV